LKSFNNIVTETTFRSARNIAWFGALYGFWSYRCRNWTCSNETVDFKPVRRFWSAALTVMATPWFFTAFDAIDSRRYLLSKQKSSLVSYTEAFGSIWKQHGIKYLWFKNCNASGWLYAANTGVLTCLVYDFLRDWSRNVTGWTWST